jgi:glycosyltransferase involved in cell wall biosynthesis
VELLYISSVPSEQEFYRIKGMIKKGIDVTTYGMNESGYKFHTLILNGLSEGERANILSLVGRSVSAGTHRGILWRTKKEKAKQNLAYKHLGFLNIPVLRQFILSISFFFNTFCWLVRHRKESSKYIIIDASYVTVIPFVLFAVKIIKCKTAAIFCDIYEYMGAVKDARETENVSTLHNFFRRMMERKYKQLDGFIILTEKMNQIVNPMNKPYEVIEGLVDINMAEVENRLHDKHENDIIMYAGALREQYGLKNLVEGFSDYANENARLWIFGAGDYSEAISKAAQADDRIIFHGLADQKEVVKKEVEATVLINPRPADREFTQYSFPSKNMEYMVSGTPVLTTKLPGMPDEYYDYIYTIEGNDKQSITAALQKVFSYSKEELHDKGKAAKRFVLDKKNNIAQAGKIIDLLRRV